MRDIVAVLAWLNDNFQIHKRNLLLCLVVFKQRLGERVKQYILNADNSSQTPSSDYSPQG